MTRADIKAYYVRALYSGLAMLLPVVGPEWLCAQLREAADTCESEARRAKKWNAEAYAVHADGIHAVTIPVDRSVN